jgi:topoisomerase-4 subunit A
MIDLPNEHDIVAMFPYRVGMELLIAASDGRGFVVDGEEAVAQTRAGKQVLTRVRERLPASAFRPTGATRSPLSATTAGC